MDNLTDYLIVISHSEDGTVARKITNSTRENAQNVLCKIISEDRNNDIKHFDDGTKDVYDLDYVGENNGFEGYNSFFEYHINYAAYPIEDIKEYNSCRTL